MSLSRKLVLVGVRWSAINRQHNVPPDFVCIEVLEDEGCKDIEALGTGTFHARVPMIWKRKLDRLGTFTAVVNHDGERFYIEGEMP